ncbi:hypothetical protein HID58_060888 [Brassica napus]|uniref:Uncharacterized protein n=1 Tax=Brassica napus TaxID=3708 RepID=A0ABQ7ZX37_BRANA|nr:hypothetical protein HID58_060888 [Brassica napus]
MSRTLLPPHFIGDLKKQKKERESERKTSRREKKWRSDYREATVNKEEAGYDGESWSVGVLVNKEASGRQLSNLSFRDSSLRTSELIGELVVLP